ncbi:MAG: autotransporter domain-containing protein [Rhizobiaceae bacterium]|nr:autotransporter domain-containing protein [Rhizobiaceae bacterium]
MREIVSFDESGLHTHAMKSASGMDEQIRARLLRGGRMTKLAGKVASYSPTPGMDGGPVLAPRASLSGMPSVLSALTFALMAAVPVFLPGIQAYADPVLAGCAEGVSGQWTCTGTVTETQSPTAATGGALTVNVVEPLSIIAASGNGITLTNSAGDTDITFIDVADADVATVISGDTSDNSNASGIDARNYGSGALSITTTGSVNGGVYYSGISSGIWAQNGTYGAHSTNGAGTSLSITTGPGTVTGGRRGIYAFNNGTGGTTISVNGDVTATNVGGRGVHVRNHHSAPSSHTAITTALGTHVQADGGGLYAKAVNDTLTIKNFGLVSAKSGSAIRGSSNNTLTIKTYGAVTSDDGVAVSATVYSHDAISTVVTGDGTVYGGSTGINGRTTGLGTLSITTGSGTVTGKNGDGIKGDLSGNGGTLEIDTGAAKVSGGINGIKSYAYGTNGDMTITTTGEVSGGSSGIYASTYYYDGSSVSTAIITGAGKVSGGEHGIIVRQFQDKDEDTNRTGTISITTNGLVEGTAGSGLYAASLDGSMDLDINSGLSGGTEGIYFNAGSGDVALDVGSDGSITGKTDAVRGVTSGKMTFNNGGILHGPVNVTGSNATTSMLTNSGTWNAFGGASVFAGAITNKGTLDQQNDKPSDTINGANILLDSTSIWKIDVSNNGNSDMMAAMGTVTIGGTLDVRATGEEGDFTTGIDYTIIDNDGTADAVKGQFASVTTNFAFLTPTINTAGGDNNDVVLTLVAGATPDFTPIAGNANQAGAANALADFDYSKPEGTRLKDALTGMTKEQAAQALGQIAGEDHDASLGLGTALSRAFRSMSMNRGRGGNRRSGSRLFGYAAEAVDETPAANPENAPSSFWVKTFAARSTVDGPSDISSNGAGIAIGAETGGLSADWTHGVSAGYAAANFDTATPGSSSTSDNYHFGFYSFAGATDSTQTGWGFSGAVGYSYHRYDSRRALPLNLVAAADYDGYTINGGMKARFGMKSPDVASPFVWAPIVAVDFSHSRNNGFGETGAGPLNITASAYETNQYGTAIGVEFSRQALLGSTPVTTLFSIRWHHEFGDTKQSNTYLLQGSPTAFLVSSPEEARDRLQLEASADFATSINSLFSLAAQSELSETSVQYGGAMTFKMSF